MKTITKLFLFLLLFFLTLTSQAFDISTLGPINSYVIDKTGILKIDEKTAIETKINELKTKYTTEILLVIIPSTNGEEISSIATDIGQKLGVGKADKDNGVVILIALNDRAWNIATGYGVEGVLPDLLTKKIGEKNFILFRDARYFDGIMGTLSDFDKAFVGDPSIISLSKTEKQDDYIFIDMIVLIFAVIISATFFKPLFKDKKYKKLGIYFIISYLITLPLTYLIIGAFAILGNLLTWILGTILGITGEIQKGGYNSSGGSSGGFKGGGGGGFGGFGGGGFGGGGSSGRW